MVALTLDFFEVLVLLSFDAVVFSWMRMVMMSPTEPARLSANIEREESAFHSDPPSAWAGNWARRIITAARRRRLRKPNGMAKGYWRRENAGPFRLVRACGRGVAACSLKADEDGLFVLDLRIELTFGFGVADAHHLAGQAV